MPVYFVDGNFVESENAALPLTDLAILRGYGVFDFLRTYGGKPFHLRDHLRRLKNSAELLYIECPWSLSQLEEIVMETWRRNAFEDANIRLLISGGESSDSITPQGKPRLVVMVAPLVIFPSQWYSDGVKIITSSVTRYIPGAKSTNYIKAIMALKNARNSGAIESIYMSDEGELFEGTTSNLFLVKDDCLITASDNILPGITRQVVLKLAGEKFKIDMRPVFFHELKSCSEAFLSSSNKEVLPVVQIDGAVLSKKPGPVTTEVMEMFHRYTQII